MRACVVYLYYTWEHPEVNLLVLCFLTLNVSILLRVAARHLADLTPPLGKPGGPCQVVQRIDHEVRNPADKQDLITDVERGRDLSNPEAAQIYDVEQEPGPGGWARKLRLTAHIQYRMDLRSVTVGDIKVGLRSLNQAMTRWKEKGRPEYNEMAQAVRTNEALTRIDPKTNLKLVFKLDASGTVNLITTFWKGRPDPSPTGVCPR